MKSTDKVTVTLTVKELDAIISLVDLASHSVSDAEYDETHDRYGNQTKSRRNGGYSSDYRVYQKAEKKIQKAILKRSKVRGI